MPLSTLNRARYVGLDFETIGDDLRSRLQVQFAADFNDFAISSQGIMLLDVVAYGLDTLSFYLDRRATDTYLATARTRKSVARLARQLGYSPGGAVSSGVDLRIALTRVYAFNVPVPQGFRLQGPDGLFFETARPIEFIAGSGPADFITVPAFEGQTFIETFVSDGTANQVCELRRLPPGKAVVQGAVSVLVDGAPFNGVPLLEYGKTDQFEVGFADEPPTVRFGDGLSGNIPAVGATIEVTYVASSGKLGQAIRGSINSVVSPLVVMAQSIPLSVTNPSAAVGGDDAESLSSIKTFAPKVFKSRGVAVTGPDYEALSGSYADPLFGRVAVAKAISTRSAVSDITLQNSLNAILLAFTTAGGEVTTQTALVTAALLTANTALTAQAAAEAAVLAALSSLTGSLTGSKTAIRSAKSSAGEVSVDAADIQALAVSGSLQVEAYGPTGTADLTAPQEAAIKNFFNLITAEAVLIASAAASIVSSADTALAGLSTAEDHAADAVGAVGDVAAERALVAAELVAIDTSNDALAAADIALSDVIEPEAQAIYDHVDGILSADCRANVVTVPILTRDPAGFYAAPSNGLILSLQDFLTARKEVTQTVRVASGAAFLVPAVITVRVGVSPQFSEAAVATAVGTAIDGVLRGRAFGSNLYVSALKAAIASVAGVVFSNAVIDGSLINNVLSTSKLDVSGNLVVQSSEVVTKGTVTVNTELAE